MQGIGGNSVRLERPFTVYSLGGATDTVECLATARTI